MMFKIQSFSHNRLVRLFFILMLWSIVFPAMAQSRIVDSLVNIIKTTDDNAQKLNTYLELTKSTALEGDSVLTLQYTKEGIELAINLSDEKSVLKFQLEQSIMLSQRTHYDQSLLLQKEILESAKEKGYEDVFAETLHNSGLNQTYIGNFEEAQSLIEQAFELSSEIELPEITFESLRSLIRIHIDKSEFEEALQKCDLALQNDFVLNDDKKKYSIIQNKGSIHMQRGNMEIAKTYFQQSRDYYIKEGNEYEISIYHNTMAIIYSKEKKYRLAIKEFEKALEISKNLNLDWLMAIYYCNLAEVYLLSGNYTKPLYYCNEALKINTKLKDDHQIAITLYLLGKLQSKQGNHDQALKTFQKALKIAERLNLKSVKADILKSMGENYALKNNTTLTVENYSSSLSIFKEIGDTSGWAEVLYDIGLFNLKKEKVDTASHLFYESTYLLDKISNWKIIQKQFNNVGDWYVSQGQIPKAIHYFDLSFEIALSAEDTLGMAIAYSKIASAYKSQKEYEDASTYIKKSFHLYEKVDHLPGIAQANSFMGNLAIEQNDPKKSLSHSFTALRQYQTLEDSCNFSPVFINIGKSFLAVEKIDSAFYYISQALNQAGQCINNEVSAEAYLLISEVNKSQKRDQDRLLNLEKALALAQKSQNKSIIMNVSNALYPVYHDRGQLQKAFELQNLYYTNKEAVLNTENTYKLSLRDKQKEDSEKALIQQRKDLIKERQLARQQLIIYISIPSLLILLSLLFAYYRNYKAKKKANILLNNQNELISNQKEELEKLDSAKSRLFANISHELRTPLTLISAPIQQLLSNRNTQLDKKDLEQLKVVKRNAQQLKGLVNDILDLSKLESNRLELVEGTIAIIPFLKRVFGNFDSLAQHLKINYQFNTDISDDTYVSLDGEKTEKIINNLISNAIKHTPSGGTVLFDTKKIGDQLQVQIIDTGAGIPEEDIPHIFDRFFQSKNSNTSLQGGTGIGLALAKELTLLMDGELSVESELESGSTFTLKLPYKSEPTPTIPEIHIEPEEIISKTIVNSYSIKNHTVLIVEDHPDMQRFVQQLLSPHHKTFTANNGIEALQILDKESIDLIVSDVMMPEMDGYELLQKVKEHSEYYQIPVVMLTALNTEESKLQALTIGVDDYLGKPFSPEELLARVENLLERYDVRQKIVKEIQSSEASFKKSKPIDKSTESQPIGEVIKETIGEKEIRQKDIEWIHQIEAIFKRELENPEFNLTDLANQFFLSERQFRRRMNKLTGMSPKKFQQEIALQEARKLLEQKAYGSVKAIAYSIGMSNNIWRFSKLYEARFGKKPSDYF